MSYEWPGSHGGRNSGKKKPNYAVKWEWRNPDVQGSYRQMTDLVDATNAERAISKVRKMIQESDDFGRPSRRDVIIISAVPIEGMYYDA